MKPRLFLDMDGVVADMERFIIEFHGKKYHELDREYMWQSVKGIEGLFANLHPIEGAKEFVDTVWNEYSDRYQIAFLTSLPFPSGHLITADMDKRQWLKKHISDSITIHTVMGWTLKRHYINDTCDILVDDAERNIKSWTSHGGIGILHTSYEDTLIKLRELM